MPDREHSDELADFAWRLAQASPPPPATPRKGADLDYEEELARVIWRIEQLSPRATWPDSPRLGDRRAPDPPPPGAPSRRRAERLLVALACLAMALLFLAYAVGS